MVSKNLYYNIIIRSCLIAVLSLLVGWIIFHLEYYILGGIIFSLVVVAVIEMINYFNRTNEKIAFFFDAIRNDDSTLSFPDNKGNRTIRELNKSLNRVNELIKKTRIEQQQQEQYFQTILEHVSIGIITFNDTGLIFLSNTTAKNLLNYEHLNHIKQLERVDHKLYSTLQTIQPGDRKLVRINTNKGDIQLSLKSTQFKTPDNNFQLVAIQDIKNELDKNELDSWIKLIRVLTHEIMNTIAPITSLSQTLLGYYKGREDNQLSEKTINNTIKGLEVINERGMGLISFVDSYRKLTKLPEPVKKPILVRNLFESIITLINIEPNIRNIHFEIDIEPDELEVMADEKQLSQVMINLCKNSVEALNKNNGGKVILKGLINDQGRPQFVVTDDGPGIPNENLDKIFIPFFTTKESGSGIGLSLSRQIMQLHGGNLTVKSIKGKETSMIMAF